jgi:hypothetical protein
VSRKAKLDPVYVKAMKAIYAMEESKEEIVQLARHIGAHDTKIKRIVRVIESDLRDVALEFECEVNNCDVITFNDEQEIVRG